MNKLFALLLAISLTGCLNYAPSGEEVSAMHTKHNCVPTNEFVGKDAERLYNCNGVMYKEITLYYWAYEAKRDAK